MAINTENEHMLGIYICETEQLLDRLEQILMSSEDQGDLDLTIKEIFRIMHTIKGNSMMMLFEDIGTLAHSLEDLFDYVSKDKERITDFSSMVDLVLESLDFMKVELQKIVAGEIPDGKSEGLVNTIHAYMESLKFMNSDAKKEAQKYDNSDMKKKIKTDKKHFEKQAYRAIIHFQDDCEMENVRAFAMLQNLKEVAEEIIYFPKNIIESDDAYLEIKKDGFETEFHSGESYETLQAFFNGIAFLENVIFEPIDELTFIKKHENFDLIDIHANDIADEVAIGLEVLEVLEEKEMPKNLKELEVAKELEAVNEPPKAKEKRLPKEKEAEAEVHVSSAKSIESFINVGVTKVDALMDLIGELVVSESMVVNDPDIQRMELENFEKNVRQHRMIIRELQDVIMSIRMVPLELTFQKMNRIVRDMSKKMVKDVRLEITGADTEVDKSVIEHIGDPLMHIIRNAIDHGIESSDERVDMGKQAHGTVQLDARQSGGFVYISIKDDGKGLDHEMILDKAEKQGLLMKPRNEYQEREAFQFVFAPGFSTKEKVTEYSGRGVGLDVVTRNIQTIGGVVTLDSQPHIGSEFVFKIPLSLAILEGMLMEVGSSTFSVPITSIRDSLNVKDQDIIRDPRGNEMIMIRGQVHPILRLHQVYEIETKVESISDGILILIENEQDSVLLFADAILGEQQLVVKPLPKYLSDVNGLGGCALLGDGNICLILDPAGMTQMTGRR